MDIKNLIRIGEISSVNPLNCAARVTFADKDGMVSAELPVINRGSSSFKDYWVPRVGEQVLCLFLPNGRNLTQGFILGTYFSEIDKPNTNNLNKRKFSWNDGTAIEYDSAISSMNISCAGKISITAPKGDVVVNGISLVHHTHTGDSGGSTSKPQ